MNLNTLPSDCLYHVATHLRELRCLRASSRPIYENLNEIFKDSIVNLTPSTQNITDRNVLLSAIYTEKLNDKISDDYTALMLASRHGDKHLATHLLSRGADTEITNDQGWTALLLAARNGHDKVVLLLLAYGADTSKKLVNNTDIYTLTEEMRHLSTLKILREHTNSLE